MSLIHLIYVSSLTVTAVDATVNDILASSYRNNLQHQITGMLLLSEGNFLQILEGEEAAVLATFARIQKDQRHKAIYELLRAPIAEREFANWKMGFKALTAADLHQFSASDAAFFVGFNPQNLQAKPGIALDLLLHFSQTNR